MNNNKELEYYRIILDYSKFEGESQWKVFSAFLIAHTVFMAFLLQSGFTSNPICAYNPGVFIAGILGVILCFLWLASYHRNKGYCDLRLAQAKKFEPDDMKLVKDENIEKFSNGNEIIVEDTCLQIGWAGRISRTRRSVPFLIYVFALFYIIAFIIKGPWFS